LLNTSNNSEICNNVVNSNYTTPHV
jgi:hypothetical protein